MADETVTRICSRCGAMEECPADGMPVGWSFEFTDGRLSYMCTTCLRSNIRAVEAKLPEEYWE